MSGRMFTKNVDGCHLSDSQMLGKVDLSIDLNPNPATELPCLCYTESLQVSVFLKWDSNCRIS